MFLPFLVQFLAFFKNFAWCFCTYFVFSFSGSTFCLCNFGSFFHLCRETSKFIKKKFPSWVNLPICTDTNWAEHPHAKNKPDLLKPIKVVYCLCNWTQSRVCVEYASQWWLAGRASHEWHQPGRGTGHCHSTKMIVYRGYEALHQLDYTLDPKKVNGEPLTGGSVTFAMLQ